MSSDPERDPGDRPGDERPVTGTYPTVPDPDVVAQPTPARDRRTGDAALRRAAERRLAAVVEGMSEAFLSLDANWRVTYANRAACDLNGTTRAALVGRDHWAQWPETAGGEVEREYRRVATERVPARFDHYYPRAQTWHAIQVYPAEGGGLAVFFRDITVERASAAERERLLLDSERARADAEAARAEAESANRSKAHFLATMSHELRTPLNAIGGYAELMEMGIRGPVSDAQRHDLARIQASQRHLLGLINEVLDYAKLETGAVRYDITTVAVCDALAAAEALVEPQARAKALTLTVRACTPEVAVRADPEKLRQILVNLLSNAVKFTDAGGCIDLACAHDAERVRLTVRDTGIGIPADKLDAVFEPFVQVRTDLTRATDGTGLGLAISRDLARGMGGDLVVESTLGAGSAFTLTLRTDDV
ncbi:MAG TPA: PAS domain-containing sensor histidine kinase [Gemmatirosa sp.]